MATFDDYIIRITERGAKETAAAIGVVGKESERTTGFVASLNRTLFALGSILSVKNILEYTDSWQSMTNQLKIVTKDAKELQTVQERLFKQAQNGRTDLGALTDLYQKLRMSQKEVGVSGENLFRVTDTVSKALAVSGKSGQAAANGLRQFVQGLVSGKLQGEELRSVLENTPYLAKTLADGLRVPVGALRELGAEGKLTSQQVVEALLRMESAVNKDFGKTAVTISQAMTVLNNAFTRFIGQSGEVSTASSILAQGILLLANNIDKLALGLAVAAGAWITYRAAVASVAAAQWLANAAIAANPIVRMAVIIATVVAGFVALTGSTEEWVNALKKMGETAVAAFKWITTGISSVISFFTELGSSVTMTVTSISTGFTSAFDGITSYLKSWYDWLADLIMNKVPKAFSDAVSSVVKFFTEGFNTIKTVVMGVIDSITNAIKSFIDKAIDWFNKLIQAARTAASEGAGNSSSGNNGIAGARAGGGSVLRGKTYLVGENGPELWTAERSGYIIPNGGSGGGSVIAANENRSTAKTLAAGFREALGEQFTELLDTTKSNNTLLQQIAENTKQLSETVKQSAASAAASETTSGYSAINNFGIPTKETSSTSSATSSGGGSSLSSGGSSGSSSSSDPGNYSLDLIRRWAKEYASYINEYRGKPYGTGRYKNELEATYAANRWMNASVPGSAHSEVQSLAQTYYKATQSGAQVQFRSGGQIPAFATGGSFTVPGSTGVDSKLVNMRVSPGEQIDIRTRKQVREEREEWGNNGNTNNVTFNIQASDVDSFRRSEKQVRREMMRNLMKDAS